MNTLFQFFIANPWILIVIVFWTLLWKGVALWRAARNEHAGWFIALLILNTLGILEIIYIFFFSQKRELPTDIPADEPIDAPTVPPDENTAELKIPEVETPEKVEKKEEAESDPEKIDDSPILR